MQEPLEPNQNVERDRNLLFGVLAVQLQKVSPSQMVEAAAVWAADPSKNLADRLESAGYISRQDRDLISAFVEQAVKVHEGDPVATLASFGGEEEVKRSLGQLPFSVSDSDPATTPTILVEPPERNGVPAVQEAAGRYVQVSEYAKGGMGRILLVHDQFVGRQLALKELVPSAGSGQTPSDRSPGRPSASLMARFVQEARITGQLEHPSIVPLYELGYRRDGTLYYTMKFLRGDTLGRAVTNAGSYEKRLDLLPHFVDVCQAIAYAHSRGVIHRDIKPSNVIIGEFGETVVIDWGLAKARGRDDINACRLAEVLDVPVTAKCADHTDTLYGAAIGTPAYMPPEQALGQIEKIDERSDIYSLGVVLYEILTGRVPFQDTTVVDVMKKVVNDEPAPVSKVEPRVPPDLAAICERAMQKDPDRRYQSAQALAEDMERFLSGGLVHAYEYRFGEHLRRFARKNRLVLGVVALAMLSLLGVGVFSYLRVLEEKTVAIAEKGRAEAAQMRAMEQAQRAERQFYYASIGLADRAIKDYRYEEAKAYLADCPLEYRQWEWGRLQYLCNLDRMTIQAQKGPVPCVAFSPDGRYLATAGDTVARVWDATNGQSVRQLEGDRSLVTTLAFSPDGHHLAVGTENRTTRIFDLITGEGKLTLEGHWGALTALAYSPDGAILASASRDDTAMLWNASTGAQLRTIEGHSEDVTCVAFSPDGHVIATGSNDNTVMIWDVATGTPLAVIEGHLNDVTGVAFSPSGRQLATSSRDGTAKVWDWESQRELGSFSGHNGEVTAVAFASDGHNILTTGRDRTIRQWDIEFLESSESANSSQGPRPDRTTVQSMVVFGGHSSPVRTLALHPDGETFATGDDQGIVKLWNRASSLSSFRVKKLFTELQVGAGSPDRGLYATQGSSHSEVVVWSTERQDVVATLQGHQAPVYGMAFSNDNRYLATAGADKTVRLWDVRSSRQLRVFQGHRQAVTSVAFRPDGKLLASGSSDTSIILWDVLSGRQAGILKGHSDIVRAVAFSPSGDILASGGDDNVVYLWDVASGKEVQALTGHSGPINALAYSRDGARLASAGEDSTVILWDGRSGAKVAQLDGHAGAVVRVAFSPDGMRLVTGGLDDSARLWDTETGQELLTFQAGTNPVWYADFWPAEMGILTSSGSDIILWPHFAWTADAYEGEAGSTFGEQVETYKRKYWREAELRSPWDDIVEMRSSAETIRFTMTRERLDELAHDALAALEKRTGATASDNSTDSPIARFEAKAGLMEQIGMKRGDTLRAFNGRTIATTQDLIDGLKHFIEEKGETLQFEVLRDQRLVIIDLSTKPTQSEE